MGRDGTLYEIAQWYPRMAVYDDVHGWNTDQYLGQGEFYLEYGDIDYEVTLPAGYIVAGTRHAAEPGAGADADPARPARRGGQVRQHDGHRHRRRADLGRRAARRATARSPGASAPSRCATSAWAASPEYQWDASGWDGILAQAYYRPVGAGPVAGRGQDEPLSRSWSTARAGSAIPIRRSPPSRGRSRAWSIRWSRWRRTSDDAPDLYNVITHEIGHMWYPMTVGSDERRYAWMDEGFNTFINTFSEEDYWKRDDSQTRRSETRFVTALDQTPTAQPIMTPANRYRNNDNLGALAYVKPSIMLLALRNKVLGAGGVRHRVPRVHPALGVQASRSRRTSSARSRRCRAATSPGSGGASSTPRRRSTRAVESVKQTPDGIGAGHAPEPRAAR